jgi:hypothetical protein
LRSREGNEAVGAAAMAVDMTRLRFEGSFVEAVSGANWLNFF